VESYVGDNIKPTIKKQINKNSRKSLRVK